MEERKSDEFIGKPPPEDIPEEAARKHPDYQGTDLGALRTRGSIDQPEPAPEADKQPGKREESI